MSAFPVEIRYIEWLDSLSGTGWTSEANVLAEVVSRCYSAGFVLKETNDAITLVQSIDPEGKNVDNYLVIPKFAIVHEATVRKARA